MVTLQMEVYDLAVEVLGGREKAYTWMRTPNTRLNGRTPQEQLNQESGYDIVMFILRYGDRSLH